MYLWFDQTIECLVEEHVDPAVGRQARWEFNDIIMPLSREKRALHVTLLEQVR